jgi:hypothetical protein
MNPTLENYFKSSILDEDRGAHAYIIATPVSAPLINSHKVTFEFTNFKTLRFTRRRPRI